MIAQVALALTEAEVLALADHYRRAAMTRAEVERIVREAREAGVPPDLRDASLYGADLRYADLRYADLRYADLRDADLRYADLRGADLRYADLDGADLRGVRGVVPLGATPSGPAWMVPTVYGWRITIGCWRYKTLDDLRALLDAPDEDWPEARGEERAAREPILRAVLAYAEAQAAYRQEWLDAVIERWGETEASR